MLNYVNFQMLNQPCIPKINPTLPWCTNFLYMDNFDLLIFCYYFWFLCSLEILVSIFLWPKLFKNATEFEIVSVVLFVGYSRHVACKDKPVAQRESLY